MTDTRFRLVIISALLFGLIAAIYVGGQKNRQVNAPISFDPANPDVVLKMTDHDTVGEALKNSLTDNSQAPDYSTAVYVRLKRDNGELKDLVRFQGELVF